jgi:hypothetical protein
LFEMLKIIFSKFFNNDKVQWGCLKWWMVIFRLFRCGNCMETLLTCLSLASGLLLLENKLPCFWW